MTAGRVVHDLGGRPRAGVPTGEDAMAMAEALEVIPLRARVASATADELDRLELPAALDLKDDNAPRWWRVTARMAR